MKYLWCVILIGLWLVSCDSSDSLSPDVDENSEFIEGENPTHHFEGKNSSGKISENKISSSGETSSSSVFVNPKDIVKDTLIEDTTIVSTVNELPACTFEKEGQSFLVGNEGILYFCISNEWFLADNIKDFYDIKCKDGELLLEEFTTNPVDSPLFNFTSKDSLVVFRKSQAKVIGVIQKGPFRYGSSVKLIELDSVQRLSDSKRIHQSCVLASNGAYFFENIDFVSPYVRVEASGYFRNEITGGLSQSPTTLNAIIDVTNKDTVNVNMLTHMEAPRVMKLIENSGNNQPIRAVKAQALSEILSSFEISFGNSSGNSSGMFGNWGFGQRQNNVSTDGKFAEDVSLFGGDEEYSGALLAVSIMMQRKGSGKEMLQYSAEIAERIKGNGNWDDNSQKADLADWLMVLDTSGMYSIIRNNISQWNMGKVPEFEKHLRNFWTKIYQFESCNSMNAGKVKHINNSLSKFFISYYEDPNGTRTRFICDSKSHIWRVATDIEKDTVGFGLGTYDGQIRNGVINLNKYYVYEQSNRIWREATSDDIQDFVEMEDVYKNLKSDEKVIFILRHAERTDDTGKKGHLTDNGKKQSQTVGAKLKGESIYFANSTYTRSYETCENIAIGAFVGVLKSDTIPELDGEWYIKNETRFESYKNSDGGGWSVVSAYAYKNSYLDAFYDLETRSEEFMTSVVKPKFSKVNRVGVWVSHDMLVAPLVAYCTNRKANLRYFDTKSWINYLAGVAIIMDSKGNLRYVPIKGLSSGTMTL